MWVVASSHMDFLHIEVGWLFYIGFKALLAVFALIIANWLFWTREFHWRILTRCQDKTSDCIRRYRFSDNTKNPATQLPPEILLAIFEQLRLRSRFGTGHGVERNRWQLEKMLEGYSKSYRDLVPVTRVCKSWNGPASAILYQHVVLLLGNPGVDQFAAAIQRRPELRLGMRGLHFDAVYDVSKDMATALQNHPVLDLLRDEHCPQKVTLTISFTNKLEEDDETPADSNSATVIWNEEVLHLLHRHSRVRDLGIIGDLMRHRFNLPVLAPHSGLFHSSLSNLQTLRLVKLELRPNAVPTDLNSFQQLRVLIIVECEVQSEWLRGFVRATPVLERLELMQNTVNEDQEPLDPALSLVLAPVCATLLHLCTNESLGNLGRLDAFTSLRTTTLELRTVLGYIDESREFLPATLEELIIYMPWRSMRKGKTQVSVPPHRIFKDIQSLRAALPSWLRRGRRLKYIEIWDAVTRKTWKPWEVISFLWKAELERRGITLNLNLR